MKTKIFSYNRNMKSPRLIKEQLDDFLSQISLKYVIQNEAPHSSRVLFTILFDYLQKDQKSKLESVVIRQNSPQDLEDGINLELENIQGKVLFYTQSLSSNTILTIIIFEKT